MRTPMVWFEIIGQHSDKLRAFYEEVLDWQLESAQATARRRGATVASRRSAFRRRGAPDRGGPPWWLTFYTCVPDLESALDKARSLGGRVLVPPTRHGETTIAVVSDPEGHPVGLCS